MLISELDSDDSSKDAIVEQIAETKKNIQDLKKERTQISHHIEHLMNDLQCAQRAKEVSDAAALRILKRLQELFGANFKSEDLVGKIIELQTRAKNAKQESDELGEQLNEHQRELMEKQKHAQEVSDEIQQQIKALEDEGNGIDKKIDDLGKKTKELNEKTNDENNEYDKIKSLMDFSRVLKNNSYEKIKQTIYDHSDEKFAKQCKERAAAIGIHFTGDPIVFLSDLTKAIHDLKEGYKPKIPPAQLQSNVRKAFHQIKNLNAQRKILEENLKALQHQLAQEAANTQSMIEAEIPDIISKEKKRRRKRIILLQESLLRAARYANIEYNIDETDGMFGTCQSYINFASILQQEMIAIQQNKVPSLNLTALQRKVHNVKVQNNIVCRRLKETIK